MGGLGLMADTNKLIKSFSNFKGIDLRSPTLLQDASFATEAKNVDIRDSGSLNKRKGYQASLTSGGGFGCFNFNNTNTSTGAITEEFLTLDSVLKKMVAYSLSITYTGASTAWVSTYVGSDGHFYLDLYVDYACVLNQDLGTGINEVAPVTIAALTTIIHALADFTCTNTGADTTPAAFLALEQYTNLPTTVPVLLSYNSLTSINSCLSSNWTLTVAAHNNSDFENASFAQLNNILYIATKYNYLQKYDGQNVYRAGLPQATIPVAASAGAGASIPADPVRYILTYEQTDNKGNIIEGIPSTPSVTYTPGAPEDINVTITNILAASGFNTNCGVVAGAQNGVTTITVDNGSGGANTFIIGDKAYFYDGVSASYVTRNITNRSATTITIDGAAVNVLDNAVISNNLKINIWRTVSGGDTFYFVATIANNSFTATQVFLDSVGNASLGDDFVYPVKEHGLPPIGAYLAVYQTCLCIGGQPTAVDQVSYSDIDGPEYFPSADNAFTVESAMGDKITGIAPYNNSLVIFKKNSIHVLSGALVTDQFRIDLVGWEEIGCSAFHTIKQVRNNLVFANEKGVFYIDPSGAVNELSYPIASLYQESVSGKNYSKMFSTVWQEGKKYLLFLPVEELDTNYHNTTSSVTFAFDLDRSSWFEWNNLNIGGGACLHNGDLYFIERRLGTVSGNVEYYTYKFLTAGNEYDYHDHGSAISFTYKSNWETLGEPSIPKKFLRGKVYAVEGSKRSFESSSFTLDLKTERDYIDTTITDLVLDFGSGGGGWGLFEWGIAPWGESRLFHVKSKLNSSKVQALRLILENDTINENVLISGYELETVAPYKPFIKA